MEKTTAFEIQIPFAGFYNSYHDMQADDELESLATGWEDATGAEMPQKLFDMFHSSANYAFYFLEYAKAYTEKFNDEYLQGALRFKELTSPKFYNFETDTITAEIDRATLAKIWKETDKEILTKTANERHSHRSGFISFYSPDWTEWGTLSEWDHNQLATLLLAYLETSEGKEWEHMDEVHLTEDFSGSGEVQSWMWHGTESNRAWKIYNYMTYTRPERLH